MRRRPHRADNGDRFHAEPREALAVAHRRAMAMDAAAPRRVWPAPTLIDAFIDAMSSGPAIASWQRDIVARLRDPANLLYPEVSARFGQ